MASVMRWNLCLMLLAIQMVLCLALPSNYPSGQSFKSSKSKSSHLPSSNHLSLHPMHTRGQDEPVDPTNLKHQVTKDLRTIKNVFMPDVAKHSFLARKRKELRSRHWFKEDAASHAVRLLSNDKFMKLKRKRNKDTSSSQDFQRKYINPRKHGFIHRLLFRSRISNLIFNALETKLKKETSSNASGNVKQRPSVYSRHLSNDFHSSTSRGMRVKRQSGSNPFTWADLLHSSGGKQASPPSDNTGSLPMADELQVIYIDTTGTFLRVSGEGTIHSVNRDEIDKFCVIHVKVIDQTENGDIILKLQGEWTQFYLAMNSDSHLYATPNANDPNTDFIHHFSTSYDAYKSYVHGSYIAFDDGKPLNTKVKSTTNEKTHFFLRNPGAYDSSLVEKVKGYKPKFRIATTTPPSTTALTTTVPPTTTARENAISTVSSTNTPSLSIATPSEGGHHLSKQIRRGGKPEKEKRKRKRRRKGCKKKKNRNKKRCKKTRKGRKERRKKKNNRKGKKKKTHRKRRKNSNRRRKTRSIYQSLSNEMLSPKDTNEWTSNGVDVERMRMGDSTSKHNNELIFKTLMIYNALHQFSPEEIT